jgi:hypothetical protein
MPQGLGLSLPLSHFCFHSLHDVVGFTTLSICHICHPEVVKRSISEHWPLWFGSTLLLGEMLDVASYGQYLGKLRLLCQAWYVYSSCTMGNFALDCQYIRNSDTNRPTRHDS